MPHTSLPTANAVRELVAALVGKKVEVKPTRAPTVSGVTATFVDDAGKVAFVALADVACLASVGAALALIPPALVTEAVRTGKPSEALVENAHEVFNVASKLFNTTSETAAHVRILDFVVGARVPALAASIAKPLARADFEIHVEGYASGKLSLLAVSR